MGQVIDFARERHSRHSDTVARIEARIDDLMLKLEREDNPDTYFEILCLRHETWLIEAGHSLDGIPRGH